MIGMGAVAERMCPVCGSRYALAVAFCPVDGARLLAVDEASSVFADADPLVGTLVGGRYRLLKRIGEGGMGVVYVSEHEAIEKRVAIKVLKEQYAQREDVVARFQQEAKSASRVKHEGVLEVFDFGRTDDGRFFLAMELLDGTDLAHVLEREGRLDPSRAVRLATRMARALLAAHAKGVIHRDMKPENVFIRPTDDGVEPIKIVDFGIAQLRADGENASDPNAIVSGRKLTKTGMIFGTPEYMSPEQAAGRGIDLRVDVYALGVILFEMVTGKTPFRGETFMAILTAHLMQPVPSVIESAPAGVYVSEELDAVVRRALAKSPDDRFRSMADFAEALLQTPEGRSGESTFPQSPSYSSQFPSGMRGNPANVAPTDVLIQPLPPPPAISLSGDRLFGGERSVPPRGRDSESPSFSDDAMAPTFYSNDPPPPAPGARLAKSTPGSPTARQASGPPEETMGIATASAPPRRSVSAVALASLVLLGGAGVGAFFLTRAPRSAHPDPPEAASSVPVVRDPIATTGAPQPHVGASGTPSTASGHVVPVVPVVSIAHDARVKPAVTIRVESTPAGAVVEREIGKDWTQVCDATPCEVVVDQGDAVHVRASRAGIIADKRLLAARDQRVHLQLTAKPRPSTSQELCEYLDESGIKVWRACKR